MEENLKCSLKHFILLHFNEKHSSFIFILLFSWAFSSQHKISFHLHDCTNSCDSDKHGTDFNSSSQTILMFFALNCLWNLFTAFFGLSHSFARVQKRKFSNWMRSYIIIYFMMLRHDFRNGFEHTKSLQNNREWRENSMMFVQV